MDKNLHNLKESDLAPIREWLHNLDLNGNIKNIHPLSKRFFYYALQSIGEPTALEGVVVFDGLKHIMASVDANKRTVSFYLTALRRAGLISTKTFNKKYYIKF